MNKGSTGSDILVGSFKRSEMPRNVVVPERKISFSKVENKESDVKSTSFDRINTGIEGGVAVKSTLFNPDNFSNTAAEERRRERHIDYRGKLENTPEKRALRKVSEIGSNLAAFRANAAGVKS